MSGNSLGSIAHYSLVERLDPAGPGDLFRARDTRLGRTVVVRRMPQGASFGGVTREALVSSVRGLSGFSHPNVTAVFDAGIHNHGVYVVFEFLNGHSLRVETGGRPMSVRGAVDRSVWSPVKSLKPGRRVRSQRAELRYLLSRNTETR